MGWARIFERIAVKLGDTDYPRPRNSTGATTSTAVANAVQFAAQGLRQRFIDIAVSDPRSALHGVAADEVNVEDGRLALAQREGAIPTQTSCNATC
jgi:xanthine dehydrogenase YagR molybdenum-binding subunit